MSTATSYEITRDLRDALSAMEYLDEQIEERRSEIEAASGVLPDDLAGHEALVMAKLEALLGEGEQKLENLALVRRDLKLRVDVEATHKAHMAGEADRYRGRQRIVERAVERLKDFSASLFKAMNTKRVDGERIKTRVQRGAMMISPLKPDAPPFEYCVETWSMRMAVAEGIADIIRETTPAALGEIERQWTFVAELAKDDVQQALNLRALSRGEGGEPTGEPGPGDRIVLADMGIVVEFGTTVIDW